MSSEALRVVREIFDATNRRDFPRAMALYADDVELHVTGLGPMDGAYAGKEAVGRFFGDWLQTFDGGFHFDLAEVAHQTDAVAVVARHRATGARSGITLDVEFFYAYRVRGGLIVRVEMHDTREAVFRAAGIAP